MTAPLQEPGPAASFATCPSCGGRVALDQQVFVTEIVVCPECTAELEVIGTDPVEFALAPEIEEDWGE